MKKYQIAAIVVATATVAFFYGRARFVAEMSDLGEFPPAEVIDPNERNHVATRGMIQASDRAAGVSASDFEALANDGATYQLSEIVKDGPAVLIFIKDGCPCSRSADPFFRRMHAAGRGSVPFFGVIDGGPMVAERWAGQNGTVFPILADPERKIIQAYGAESSAYVAFIGRGGTIEKLWAGYSEEMLRELGRRMAPWVKPGMEEFDVSDAPTELYAGCPY